MFASHSFRRGGASFAFQSGVPVELINPILDGVRGYPILDGGDKKAPPPG